MGTSMPETACQSSGVRAVRKRFDARMDGRMVDGIGNLASSRPAVPFFSDVTGSYRLEDVRRLNSATHSFVHKSSRSHHKIVTIDEILRGAGPGPSRRRDGIRTVRGRESARPGAFGRRSVARLAAPPRCKRQHAARNLNCSHTHARCADRVSLNSATSSSPRSTRGCISTPSAQTSSRGGKLPGAAWMTRARALSRACRSVACTWASRASPWHR